MMSFFALVRTLVVPSPEVVGVAPFRAADEDYEPPLLVASGDVRQVTLGSSPSGNADANSQYYW